MEKFTLQIVTPDTTIYNAECVEVNLPGASGRFSVLVGHMNMISLLEPGLVEIKEKDDGHMLRFVISQGFADVTAQRCTLLVEKAHTLDKVDVVRSRMRLEEILQVLAGDDITEYTKSELNAEAKLLEVLLHHHG